MRPDDHTPAGLSLLLLVGALQGGTVQAAACNPDALVMDRGETRRLVFCATGLPDRHHVSTPAGVELRYDQRLRHCAVGDQRPGVHVVLEATAAAASGVLTITNRDSGVAICDPVSVTVPDRLLLPGARLTGTGDQRLTLELDAPDGIDLARSCARPLQFPAADGRQLAGDPTERPPKCSKNRLRAPVRSLDERLGPVKIVVPDVGRSDGSVTEAVAYADPPSPAWLRAMAESDAKFTTIAGVRTRYFEKGKGEALLLVHGGQPSSMDGTAWDWQQNFDGLARRFHVYALDRLGQGYTDNPANLDDYADYYTRVVEHVRGFMDAMGLERAHLVGHSQGSWPVTRIALDQPARIASLTLVDGTMVSPSRDAGSAIRFYLYLSQDLHPLTGETVESARRGMEFFSWTRNNLTGQRIQRLVEMTKQPKFLASQAWFAKSGMSPAHPKFRALKQQILSELEAGGLQVPVLVVWGQRDPEGSLASGLELFRLVSASSPRPRLHVFGDAGHLSFVEHPGEFNRLLVDFALETR